MLALQQKATGVVAEIGLPAVELATTEKDTVVKAGGEELAVGGVGGLFVSLRLSRNIRDGRDGKGDGRDGRTSYLGTEGAVAASLEAGEDAAEMTGKRGANVKNAMKMVRHQLKGYDLDLRIIRGNAPPLVGDGLAQGIRDNMRVVGTVCRSIGTTFYHTEKGLTVLSGHRDEVYTGLGVVMVYTTAMHGLLLLASERALIGKGFTFHFWGRGVFINNSCD
jgi:hypothetical protein